MKKIITLSLVILIMFLINRCTNKEKLLHQDQVSYVTENNTIKDVLNIVSMERFSKFIFPLNYDSNTNLKLNNINSLLPYHSHINTETTLEVVNYMIEQTKSGNKIFYDIYSDSEKKNSSALKDTGLFFFKGEKSKPFAIICAGGGFSYVGSIHEAYPHALELSKMGYNAFVLQYRPDWTYSNKDLARAITYIIDNSEELEVSIDDYSLWGSSAGARMVANIGSYGLTYYGGKDYQKPSSIITAYTGHTNVSDDEVPTFAIVGENDGIANPVVMENRINKLKEQGIDAEFHKYDNLSHGFGLGIGTTAEGWIKDAVKFWEKHINEKGGNVC